MEKPLIKHQAVQFALADIELGCEAGRLLTYRAAMMKEYRRVSKVIPA